MGGLTNSGGTTVTASVEVYNPSTDSWSNNTSINTSRSGLASAGIANGKIYALAGNNNGSYYTTVEEATVRVAPVVGTVSLVENQIQINQTATVSSSFSDLNTQDTHTGVWDWGDGATSSATISESNGNGTVSGSHTYNSTGVYTITLTVNDSGGLNGSNSSDSLVVYDNTTNHVSGNGAIDSPAGAYADDTNFVGVARFAFQFKYTGNPPSPTGNTMFRLQTANMRFDSTSYDALTVNGTWAQYSGLGTINNQSGYSFMVTMDDLNPDKFRMKIWNTGSGAVKYDNQWGASDSATLTQTIASGDIKVN